MGRFKSYIMSKFKSYIRKLENKKTSLEIGTLLTLRHPRWGGRVMYGVVQEIHSDRIICGVSDSPFSREHVKSGLFAGGYTIHKKYGGKNSMKLFLTETGQEVSYE